MGKKCSTHKEEKNAYRTSVANQEEKRPLQRRRRGCIIISKWILKIKDGWHGLDPSDRIAISGGLLLTRFYNVLERSWVAELLATPREGLDSMDISTYITFHTGMKHETESKEGTYLFSKALGRISKPERRTKRERNRQRGWRKLHNEELRLFPWPQIHIVVLYFTNIKPSKVGTNFANNRRPLGRYSSLTDYKPRSLVFIT
jgi:hypothetical protein